VLQHKTDSNAKNSMTFSIPTFSSPRFARSLPIPLSMCLLLLCACAALFSYGYSLRTTIHYAVERENMMESIARTRASITSLDKEYVELTKDLSLERAQALGFHEVGESLYIAVAPAPATVGRAR
jgi:hypothetical protein